MPETAEALRLFGIKLIGQLGGGRRTSRFRFRARQVVSILSAAVHQRC
jgi:hypothetical protein